MRLHREGYLYIAIATLLFIGIAYLGYVYFMDIPLLYWPVMLAAFLLWFWVIWFFRIPLRSFSMGEDMVVAPADGKVVVIEETYEPEYFKEKRLQVSIFM